MAGAYLQITLKIDAKNREAATQVYRKYRTPFLTSIAGASSKELLVRPEDVQVLHDFASTAQAEAYLKSPLFQNDVVKELTPCLGAPPEIRIYACPA